MSVSFLHSSALIFMQCSYALCTGGHFKPACPICTLSSILLYFLTIRCHCVYFCLFLFIIIIIVVITNGSRNKKMVKVMQTITGRIIKATQRTTHTMNPVHTMNPLHTMNTVLALTPIIITILNRGQRLTGTIQGHTTPRKNLLLHAQKKKR